jgi:hypothetical protein
MRLDLSTDPSFDTERLMSTDMPPTPPTSTTTIANLPVIEPTGTEVLPSTSVSLLSQTVTIPLDQLNAFTAMQARLVKVEEDQQRREAAVRDEQVKILAAKGQVEEALRTQREETQRAIEVERVQRAQIEERAKHYALDGELARALGSQPLVAGGAEQLTQLLRDHFVVEPQGNSFQVRTRDFKSVADHIGAMLGRPEFAHFLRAQNPGGGTGTTGTQSTQTSPANPMPAAQPRNLGDMIALKMADIAKTSATSAHLTGGSTIGEDGTVIRERAGAFGLRPLARQA